ncbi:MAG: Acetyl-CoA acetyltransferase [uncultured Thermomicrobiales bacterium]|uniref:Acetyl-CoA acetyltransferase n=1 Tax=uncultured Thermomicrobiales bacterium TaxID=1645740 RepID=A0A6J4VQ09_9BACT|nr:MAG: Acetyl-CoA acetyltransferase [uncultured Thermomicrobiales bacterium]
MPPPSDRERSVILGACRTPFGKLGGGLSPLAATDLGGVAVAEAIRRAGIAPQEVEHLLLGQVVGAGAGQIPSRQAGFRAGLAATVTSDTLNRVCGSGMRAVTLADVLVCAGEYAVVVAGGMESMSAAPYLLPGARFGYRLGDGAIIDALTHDGLTCAVAGVHMGVHGGNVAAEEGVTREEQDRWALRSHQRAVAAAEAGRFADEIVPIAVPGRRGTTVIDRDESPRVDTTLDALARLKPAFDDGSTVTAGNAPGINDGAAAMVVVGEGWARERGLTPLARIVAHATAAWDVPYLAYTPAMAAQRALDKAGLTTADIDLFEINEAFANVAIIAARRLGLRDAGLDRVNVNGGAIALGHPIGASGARLIATLAYELRRRGGGLGLAAICSGGAQGDAIIIEVASAE